MKCLQFPNIRDINWLQLEFILIISYLILKKKVKLLLGREIEKVRNFFGSKISNLGNKIKLFASKIVMVFDCFCVIIMVIKGISLLKGYYLIYEIGESLISKSRLSVLSWCFKWIYEKVKSLLNQNIENCLVEGYSFITTKHQVLVFIYIQLSNKILWGFANACPWKEVLNKDMIMCIILISIYTINLVGVYFLKNYLLNKSFSLKGFSLNLFIGILFKIILGMII